MALAHPLIVVRHGETDWNAIGRLQGQQDIPLNGRGRQQAQAVGHTLKRLYPPIAGCRFVASPLGRARETMELMRSSMGLHPAEYELDPRLKELTFGRWEGLTWDEVRRKDPEGAARREADKWAFVPPGGESYAMLKDRVALWLGDLSGPTVAVAHGGISRVLLNMLCGLAEHDCPMRVIAQGKALMFEGEAFRWV